MFHSMASSSNIIRWLFSFSFLLPLLLTIIPTSSQPNLLYSKCLDQYGYYTIQSTYHSNLNYLLSNLTSHPQITSGYYNLSYGEPPDQAYALGLCRADISPPACRTCLNNSATLLPKTCPDQKDSVGGYDECMVRYSDSSDIFGIELFRHFTVCLMNDTGASNWNTYGEVVRVLLDGLRARVSGGGGGYFRKYAAGRSKVEDLRSPTGEIYGYVECLPDLSASECSDCLVKAMSEMLSNDSGKCGVGKKIGGRLIKQSCDIRYESYRFFDASSIKAYYEISVPTPPSPSPSPPPPNSSTHSNDTTLRRGRSNKSMMVVAIVLPIVAFVGLLIFLCTYFKRVRKLSKETQSIDQLQFTFETIKAATDNFSDANKLGQGGFGPVYKGTLSNGEEVAVKRLYNSSGQGEVEFKNEVRIMSNLLHRNLVRLLGFSFHGEERLLIYEFLPNKSLDYFIFDPIKRAHLNWEKRYQIIEGIARGLFYLHEDSQQRIIHRDLKASNILLDAELNPKISDFGMARLLDQTQAKTNRIAGTYGYMAPEYAILGKFSVKSDIFSFGVLILEIISGQKNNGFRLGDNVEHFLSYAWENFSKGTSSNIMDNTLLNDDSINSRHEIMRCIQIGLLCVQKSEADRPNMASIVVMLSSNSISLPIPLKPAFFIESRRPSSDSNNSSAQEINNNNSNQVSVYEVSISEPHPR